MNLATADSIFVAFGDFNGVRKLDLASGKHEHRQRECAPGQCDGTFQPAMNHEAGSGPNSRGVGDFNRDGKLDLAVTNSGSGDVSVFWGNGDGTFQSAANYSTCGSAVGPVAVGFLGVPSVFIGNGDGAFRPL